MNEEVTYNIVISGEILVGFELAQVQAAAAELFKITPEQASKVVGSKRVVKKGLDQKSAQLYKQKLESIGLATLFEPPMVADVPSSMALEPTDEEKSAAAEQQKEASSGNKIVCPKCNLEQDEAEQCSGCGVFFSKLKKAEQTEAEAQSDSVEEDIYEEEVDYNSFNKNAIIAAAVAAFIGALLWKFIALAFNYELGIVAWLIGGAGGYAAAVFGSRGQISGIICGILALLAILGGKYMAISGFQSEWQETLATLSETDSQELKDAYQNELVLAKIYVSEVNDDTSMREFMIAYQYTESGTAESIPDEDLTYFKESTEPVLRNMASSTPPSYEQWLQASFGDQVASYSTFDLMQESFGLIDLVFLLLGVVTAFRLGSGESGD